MRLFIFVVFTSLALLAAPAADAATFKVTTKDDEAGGNCNKKDCSIREALFAASENMERDAIKVPKGKYVLSEGVIEIASPVSLKGAGARKTTIDANGVGRAFNVQSGPTSISNVKVTGGNTLVADGNQFPGDGGAILVFSADKFTLKKAALVGNDAQMSGGALAAPIEAMTAADIVIKNSTIARNRVTGGTGDGAGGGVLVAGDLKLINSTVAENRVENTATMNRGGGIAVMTNPDADEGSGMTTFQLRSSTIANNSIGGSAIDGAGGGIGLSDPVMGGSVEIKARNSIVAQNDVLGTTEDCGMVTTGVTSKANLSSDSSCLFDDGKSIRDTNPKLGALGFNGGPTETMVPKANSKAIDAGVKKKCPARDQRGVKRPQGRRCDIGAVEVG